MVGRLFYVWVFSLGLVGLIGSYLIRPRPYELAYMTMQDMQFEKALKQFSKLKEEGDYSVKVVMPLSKLYLQYGKVDEAIDLMEKFVKDHPDNVAAIEQLGVYYQYAQRPGDYLRNLEALYVLQPSDKVLRELANIYNFYGSYDKQIAALEQLIAKYKPTEQDFVNLAYMYASQGRNKEAVILLDKMFAKFSYEVSDDTVEFAITRYMDLGEEDKAINIASEFASKKKSVESAIRFASKLYNKGRADMAMEILKPYEKESGTNMAFFARYIELQIDNGQKDVAYERLKYMADNHILPQMVLDRYVFLLADRKSSAEIGVLLQDNKYDFNQVLATTLLDVLYVVSLQQQNQQAQTLKSRLDPAFLGRYPALDAAIKLIGHDRDGVAACDRMLKSDDLNELERIKLTKIAYAAGQKELVTAGLNGFTRTQGSINKEQMFNIAELYFDVKRPEDGFAYFNNLKQNKPGIYQREIEHIWALMATAVGHEKEVVEWAKQAKPQNLVLVDIFGKSLEYQRKEIALYVANALYDHAQTFQYRRFVADALLLNNRNEEALVIYQELVQKDQSQYVLDGYLTVLERLSKTAQEPRKSEIREELHHYLLAKLTKPGTHEAGKREVAYALYEHGWNDEAEAIFFELAKNAKPESSDVAQLLYLWKGKPKPDRLEWLRERTASADPKEKSIWYKRLVEAGQRDYIIEAVNQTGYWNQSREIRDLYLEVLAEKKQYSALRPLLVKEIGQERDIKRLARLSQIAQGADLGDVAELGYNKLLAVAPQNYEALKELALLNYYRGGYTAANRYFGEYFQKATQADHLTHFYYGDLLDRDFKTSQAQQHYHAALDTINSLAHPNVETLSIKGQLLFKTGQEADAIRLYNDLLSRPQATPQMRADFANLLMNAGRYKEAEHVLFSRKGF
ncbi:MAG: tetratricopeptide repeat protein [Alphaproteobacteria bacterium]|nr:tetratricopeptide repeat protein [Alphaproteobacteria bacterium]